MGLGEMDRQDYSQCLSETAREAGRKVVPFFRIQNQVSCWGDARLMDRVSWEEKKANYLKNTLTYVSTQFK